MFIQILTQISDEINEIKRRYPSQSNYVAFDTSLYYAIEAWCNRLLIEQDITGYILQKYQLNEVKELTKYMWQESITEKTTLEIKIHYWEHPRLFTVENQLYKYLNALFNRITIRSENVTFIVLIAFVITAVGYWIYRINQQKQQTNCREEPTHYNPKYPASTVQAPPVPIITKHFLVLVVSALQADFLKSLEAKRCVNSNDGESLYEITNYLWLGSETEFLQRIANINQYSVSKGQESEYDIYLVYIELNQADEGFKSNIDQIDRYDAFRKLAGLGVDLSLRLQMEAYENIEVYSGSKSVL